MHDDGDCDLWFKVIKKENLRNSVFIAFLCSQTALLKIH